MTQAEFRRRAEALFARANPSAVITGWVREPEFVTYPTGLRGWVGRFHAVATGYRPTVMVAEWDAETGLAVR